MSELIDVILERLQTLFNPETLGTQIVDFMIDLIVALITFAAFYLVWIIVRHLLKRFLPKSRFDKTSQAFIKTIFQYTILLLGFFVNMSSPG